MAVGVVVVEVVEEVEVDLAEVVEEEEEVEGVVEASKVPEVVVEGGGEVVE